MRLKAILIRISVSSIFTMGLVAQTNQAFNPFISQDEYNEKITTLKTYLRLYAKHKTNTFYISKLKIEPKEKNSKESVYAYWPEAKAIVLLDHFTARPPQRAAYDWLSYKAVIYLQTQVAATDKDMAGSVYAVSKQWATYIVDNCRNGRKIVLKKT